MQSVDSSAISQHKPTPSSNYNSDNSIREKNDNFWVIRIGKFTLLLIFIIITGCITFIISKQILFNTQVQNYAVTSFLNSLSAIFVSLATFFGLKSK